MTPLKNITASLLCLTITTHCQAENNNNITPCNPTTAKPPVHLVINSDNENTSLQVNLGLLDTLCGYTERARQHFSTALKYDEACVMAHAGMLMSTPAGSNDYRHHLKQLNKIVPAAQLTPPEEWYLSTFLQYTGGDLHGAAQAFKIRAARYRRDTMAACWDIVLNHYSAQESREELQSRADQLTQKYPDNGIVLYCRALLDEHSVHPSEKALQYAQKAAELLSDNPAAHLLAGHLEACSGKPEQAIHSFNHAASLALPNSVFHLTAQLACINVRIQTGNRRQWMQALKDARQLALQAPQQNPETETEILAHWEARNLLLRMLVLQSTPPGGQAINLAASTCNAPENSVPGLVQQCLVQSIRARSLAQTGRKKQASQCLHQAEEYMQRIQRAGDNIPRNGSMMHTCFLRARRSCMGALYRAKMEIYSSTKDIWNQHLHEILQQPESRFLPPVLPESTEQPASSR